MKSGLAMALLALGTLKKSRTVLGRSVMFMGVVDEEYAGVGTEDAVRRYTADAAVNMENFRPGHPPRAQRGFAWVTVETFGRAAHGSRYWLGCDAIVKMGKVLVEGAGAVHARMPPRSMFH
jgi:acetylornithine deacetylase